MRQRALGSVGEFLQDDLARRAGIHGADEPRVNPLGDHPHDGPELHGEDCHCAIEHHAQIETRQKCGEGQEHVKAHEQQRLRHRQAHDERGHRQRSLESLVNEAECAGSVGDDAANHRGGVVVLADDALLVDEGRIGLGLRQLGHRVDAQVLAFEYQIQARGCVEALPPG